MHNHKKCQPGQMKLITWQKKRLSISPSSPCFVTEVAGVLQWLLVQLLYLKTKQKTTNKQNKKSHCSFYTTRAWKKTGLQILEGKKKSPKKSLFFINLWLLLTPQSLAYFRKKTSMHVYVPAFFLFFFLNYFMPKILLLGLFAVIRVICDCANLMLLSTESFHIL